MVNTPPPHRIIPLQENGSEFTSDKLARLHDTILAQKLGVVISS
ncbi:hypothetical protein [Nostoc parmelioides]|nr:hypothetical protein [Nostoc parmelioides]